MHVASHDTRRKDGRSTEQPTEREKGRSRIANITSTRMAFIEEFGQFASNEVAEYLGLTELVKTPDIKTITTAMERSKGSADRFMEFVRTMHQLPVEAPYEFLATPQMALLARGFGHIVYLLKAGILGATFPLQAIEAAGAPAALAGMPNLLRAMMHTLPRTKSRQAIMQELVNAGAMELWIRDLSWNPNQPMESLARNLAEAQVFVTRMMWIEQALQTTAAMGMLVKRVREGVASNTERTRTVNLLMHFGNYPVEEARRIVDSPGDPDSQRALVDLVRRSGAVGTNDPMLPAEMGRIEHNRIVKGHVAFTRFALMNLRFIGQRAPQAVKAWSRYVDARKMRSRFLEHRRLTGKTTMKVDGVIVNEASVKENVARSRGEWWDQVRFVLSFMGYKGMTGVTGKFLMALLLGGPLLAGIEWRKYEEDGLLGMLKLFLAGFAYTFFAGPVQTWMHHAKEKPMLGIIDARLSDYLFTLGAATEFWNAVKGEERYTNRLASERMLMYVDRYQPVTRYAATIISACGLVGDTKKLETVDREFRKFLREYAGNPSYFAQGKSSANQEIREAQKQNERFRAAMRKVWLAVKSEDDKEDVFSLIEDALGVNDKSVQNVVASLRARKYRTIVEMSAKPEVLWDLLEYRLGEEGMRLVKAHDAMIDQVIHSLKPVDRSPSRQRSGPMRFDASPFGSPSFSRSPFANPSF